MIRLLVAAILVAAGVGAAEAGESARPAGNIGYQCGHAVAPGTHAPSDASYGKHLAAQYNTANGG